MTMVRDEWSLKGGDGGQGFLGILAIRELLFCYQNLIYSITIPVLPMSGQGKEWEFYPVSKKTNSRKQIHETIEFDAAQALPSNPNPP